LAVPWLDGIFGDASPDQDLPVLSTAHLLAALAVAPQAPAIDGGPGSTAFVAPTICARDTDAPGTPSDPAPCALRALRVARADAPVLDGRLDEAAWARAQPATGFRQQEPTPNAAASQTTEARVLYTDEAVYVGMRLRDSHPDSIHARFVRRDDDEAIADWAAVMLDSYYDRRTAFEFATTPTGTRVDVLHLDDVSEDVGWDAVWDVATSSDADGWVAEFRIPLSQLRFAGGDELTWGINFSRTISRRSEVSFWAPIPPTAGRHVSLYGDLVGLRDLSAPGGLELLPYTVGRVTRAPGDAADPFHQPNDWWGSAGLDLKYGVTSNLTLTATVNPDFGQVEADPSQVNLTAFETFYAEKRPFFNEGTEIFDFRLFPEGYAFYSRRIGRAPQLGPAVPDSGFTEPPANAPILGAMKLSGKTAGGWSVGVLEAVTGRVDVNVSGPTGIETQALEPLTSYTVGRVIRDFRSGRSGLGALVTATNRRLDDDRFDRLRSASYLAAMDGWHRFGPGDDYELGGWLLGTHARGSADAMARTQRSHLFVRPDADHLTYDPTITSMNGWAGELMMRKRGGGSWTGSAGLGARSPGVELTDLGYLSYADTWYGSFSARYSDYTAGRLRNWWVQAEGVQAQSWGLENLRRSLHVNGQATFLNFWRFSFYTSRFFRYRWPWTLRGGPALTESGYTQLRGVVRSDPRLPWIMDLEGTVRLEDEAGSRLVRLEPAIELRPTSRAALSLGPTLTWERDADQYVAQSDGPGGTVYVVGMRDQTTVALEARASYGFGPTLNLDVYAQPFITSGRYDEFRTVADAGAAGFDARLPLIPPSSLTLDAETNRYETPDFGFRNPDFDVREFHLNAVLRWEYRPGSTLFVVWTQGREARGRGDRAFGDDLERLFRAPATDVLLVKLNYWIGL
jgi:hypothetical protein